MAGFYGSELTTKLCRRTVGRGLNGYTTLLIDTIPRSMENSPMRRVIAPALLAVFVLFSSSADAGFGLFGRLCKSGCDTGCDVGCVEPVCGCEIAAPVCGCEPVAHCAPKPKFGSCLKNLFKKKSSCCDVAPACGPICEPVCGIEPACGCEMAPVDCGCAVIEPSCGCGEPVCCPPKKKFGSCFMNLFKKKNNCCDSAPVCEPACGFEPTCGCGF